MFFSALHKYIPFIYFFIKSWFNVLTILTQLPIKQCKIIQKCGIRDILTQNSSKDTCPEECNWLAFPELGVEAGIVQTDIGDEMECKKQCYDHILDRCRFGLVWTNDAVENKRCRFLPMYWKLKKPLKFVNGYSFHICGISLLCFYHVI